MADLPKEQQIVLAQLTVAFGQGAGTVFVSDEALGAALDHFIPVLPLISRGWAKEGVRVFEYARTVGRVAAFQATSDGAGTISEDHFRRGLKLVRKVDQKTIPCPFKHGPSEQ